MSGAAAVSAAAPAAGVVPLGARPVTNKWLVTVSVTFGTLMGAIDSSIVNVALPHIRGTLGATLQEITWITTAFIVANVLVMPLTGFLGRLIGQKRLYMICLGLFLAGSALCGMARTLPALVIFRAVQGFGAGALQPTEQAILRQTFPPEEQGMAMAVFAMAVMVGPAIGPTLGGLITDHYSWPWIFYINLPIGLLGLFMVWRFVEEPDDIRLGNRARAVEQRKHMDFAGILLLCLALAALQYLLEEGAKNDWFDSPLMVGCAFVALIGFAAFVIREQSATVPAVNLGLLRDSTFLSGSLIGSVMYAMLLGSMFLLPVFTQELLGYSATSAGLLLMPRTLIMILVTPLVGRLYNRVHPSILVGIGVIASGIGSLMFSQITLDSSLASMTPPLLITGVGLSFLFVPLTTAALSRVPRHQLADAAGLNSLLRQIGASIGLAVFAQLLARYATQSHDAMLMQVTALRPEVGARLSALAHGFAATGSDPATAHALAVATLNGHAHLQGTVLSFEKVFMLQGILFFAVLPLLFFLKVNRSAPAPKVDVHLE